MKAVLISLGSKSSTWTLEAMKKYFEEVMDRFRNPFLAHQLSSIALNSVSKFRSRILPTMMAYHRKKGVFPHRLTLVMSALFRFYRGVWQGAPLPVQDDPKVVRHFQQMWQEFDQHGSYEQTVSQLLANQELWGDDLSKYSELTSSASQYLHQIDEQGIRVVVQRHHLYLESNGHQKLSLVDAVGHQLVGCSLYLIGQVPFFLIAKLIGEIDKGFISPNTGTH